MKDIEGRKIPFIIVNYRSGCAVLGYLTSQALGTMSLEEVNQG